MRCAGCGGIEMRLHAIFEQSLSIDGRNMLAKNVFLRNKQPLCFFHFSDENIWNADLVVDSVLV